jgi:hypothetical protein
MQKREIHSAVPFVSMSIFRLISNKETPSLMVVSLIPKPPYSMQKRPAEKQQNKPQYGAHKVPSFHSPTIS